MAEILLTVIKHHFSNKLMTIVILKIVYENHLRRHCDLFTAIGVVGILCENEHLV